MAAFSIILFITAIAVPSYMHVHLVSDNSFHSNPTSYGPGAASSLSALETKLSPLDAVSTSLAEADLSLATSAAATFALSWALPSTAVTSESDAATSSGDVAPHEDSDGSTSAVAVADSRTFDVARIVLRSWAMYDCTHPTHFTSPQIDLSCPGGEGSSMWADSECRSSDTDCFKLRNLYTYTFFLGLVAVLTTAASIILLLISCTEPIQQYPSPAPVYVNIGGPAAASSQYQQPINMSAHHAVSPTAAASASLISPSSVPSDAQPGSVVTTVTAASTEPTPEEQELRKRVKRFSVGLGFVFVAGIIAFSGTISFAMRHPFELSDAYLRVPAQRSLCRLGLRASSDGNEMPVLPPVVPIPTPDTTPVPTPAPGQGVHDGSVMRRLPRAAHAPARYSTNAFNAPAPVPAPELAAKASPSLSDSGNEYGPCYDLVGASSRFLVAQRYYPTPAPISEPSNGVGNDSGNNSDGDHTEDETDTGVSPGAPEADVTTPDNRYSFLSAVDADASTTAVAPNALREVMHVYLPIALWFSVVGIVFASISFVLGLFFVRNLKENITLVQTNQQQQLQQHPSQQQDLQRGNVGSYGQQFPQQQQQQQLQMYAHFNPYQQSYQQQPPQQPPQHYVYPQHNQPGYPPTSVFNSTPAAGVSAGPHVYPVNSGNGQPAGYAFSQAHVPAQQQQYQQNQQQQWSEASDSDNRHHNHGAPAGAGRSHSHYVTANTMAPAPRPGKSQSVYEPTSRLAAHGDNGGDATYQMEGAVHPYRALE